MTRKRRFSSRPAPLAPAPPSTPARSTRSTSSAFLATLATPPAAAIASAVLSPPPKKRVRRSSLKAPSLADALDDCDAAAAAESCDAEAEREAALRHDVKPDPNLPEPYKRSAKVLLHKGSVYDAMLTRVRTRWPRMR